MAKRRMARGYVGGSLLKATQGVTVEVTVPIIDGLDMDEAGLYRKVGQALATEIRKSLKGGHTPDGTALPAPKPAKGVGTPLNRTGKLIASIKYRDGWVAPSTNTRQGIGKRARSNFGLLRIHISGIYWGKYAHLAKSAKASGAKFQARGTSVDPLGSLDPKLPARINALATKVMSKMLIKLRSKSSVTLP